MRPQQSEARTAQYATPGTCRPRDDTMPEGLSMYAEKVYNAMKSAGFDNEEKMAAAEKVVSLTKAPKNFVMRALDELQQKGLAKRKAREKAAGYYIIIK